MEKETFYTVDGILVTVDEECNIFGITDEELVDIGDGKKANDITAALKQISQEVTS